MNGISVVKTLLNKSVCFRIAQCSTSSSQGIQNLVTSMTEWDTTIRKQKTSKAMKAYLERAREYDEFMKKEHFLFNVGKRHLANMMGEDPETFTQKDIDRAIEYLFPSGIYDRAARPLMKPPEEVFPAKKAAEFDEAGRPHHFLFYTGKANYFSLLYDIVEMIQDLHKYEDDVIRGRKSAGPEKPLQLDSSNWISKDQLQNILVEKLADIEYDQFINAMERLVRLPYSHKYEEFINKYRKSLAAQKFALEIPKPSYDENGVSYITTQECLRKAARGTVTVRSPGTGKIVINGQDLSYFEDIQSREQVLFPLLFTGLQNSVDVECTVEGGGPTGQSGAIRWGIAWSLRSFVDRETLDRMQYAGLLTRDHRKSERKKVAQPGARKKHTWKKR